MMPQFIQTHNLHHSNGGFCDKCEEIFKTFPNFDSDLRNWFLVFRTTYPEFHISCAGRGKADQENLFLRKATRAQWGQSAHNWNCAIDTFINMPGTDLYDLDHYNMVLAPNIPDWIEWYGIPGSSFYELPHLEKKGWRDLKDQGKLKLVE